MPEGFRILQSGGDTRILENGNTRITQGYLTEAGASALTGTGTIAAAGIKSRHAASNLTGTGSIAAVARMTQQAAISISGAGSMASVALYTGAASWGGVTETAVRELQSEPTYTVTVASFSGANYYYIDGSRAATLNFLEGSTYRFDQSNSSNNNHPLRFSTTSNGSHGGGSEYTTGVTTNGTPGSSGAYTQIVVASGAPTLYYYCTNHSNMGGTITTSSTGDIRITEAGDTRIASDVVFNTGEGFIVASATKVPFLSNAYYKQSGTWIVFSPFAKYESNWQQPEKISRYSSSTSTWKRIY